MPRKKVDSSPAALWSRNVETYRRDYPHLASWSMNSEDFAELRLKMRDDGTVLAIAKGYDQAGSPVVAFGTGYDVITALMAIDKTIQGGHWRIDKPWSPKQGE